VLDKTVAPPTVKVVPTDTALPIVVAAETAAGNNTIANAKIKRYAILILLFIL